jgi:hypothetical protein
MSTQVAQDLRAAAEVLRRDGWRQDSYGSFAGCKCLYGAIHYVVSDGNHMTDAELSAKEEERADTVARRVMDVIDVHGWLELLDWNDAPDRTADEVIAALESAADAAEAQA